MMSLDKFKNPDVAFLIVRLVLAAVFISQGWGKFQNMEGTVGFFDKLGLMPFFAYLVTAVEFFGGIAMLLGIFADWAGVLLAIVMLAAIYLVTWGKGFIGGYDFNLALFACALTITLVGPGKYSAVEWFKKPHM